MDATQFYPSEDGESFTFRAQARQVEPVVRGRHRGAGDSLTVAVQRCLQVGFCAVFMLLSLPFIERPRIAWTPGLMAALAIAAVLATAAAFSIQSWAQSILPSTHTALLMTMEPVFAWLTSFLVMGERLGLRPACGALIILAGIAITELVPQPHVPTAHEA